MIRYFSVLICSLLLFSCSSNDNKLNLYPNFPVPLFAGASEPSIDQEKEYFAQSTTYQIDKAVSPETIFDFYLEELTRLSFKQDNSPFYIKTEDTEYIEQGKWETPPARYMKGWTNQDNTITIKTTLDYTLDNKVKVIFFMHPYSNPEPLMNFKTELERNGEIKEFNRILSKYGVPNEEFDFEKALKEEPNNKVLKSFVALINENAQELKSNYETFRKINSNQ